MKNFFKKLSVITMACVALLAANIASAVDTTTGPLAANSSNSIFQVSGRVVQMVLANNDATATTLRFYDAPTNRLNYTNAAYTNYITYTTNIVSVITLPSGVLQTNTNSGVFTVAQTVAAAATFYRNVATVVIPASSTIVYSPTNGLLVGFGFAVTNVGNATITTTWYPSF